MAMNEDPHLAELVENVCDIGAVHTIKCLLSSETVDSGAVSRVEISDFSDEAFLLKGLMSQDECQQYINAGEAIGFGEILGSAKNYRNCERIMFKSPELAEILWNRSVNDLSDITIEGEAHKVHIHGVDALLQGTWKPHCLNEIFRLCRYEAGGHFSPHYDGHLVHSTDRRSMKTFMVYLNGDFDGGTTNFVDESQALYMNEDGRYCAELPNIQCRVKPEAGLTIIFNHHRLHEGEALKSGRKYILRTDVIYKRADGPALCARDEEALLLAQQAERLEAQGENMKAMELYRKAFKLSSSVAASYGN